MNSRRVAERAVAALVAEYNPNQKRAPAGSPGSIGGRWIADGPGGEVLSGIAGGGGGALADVWKAAEEGGFFDKKNLSRIELIGITEDGEWAEAGRRVIEAIDAVGRDTVMEGIEADLPRLKRERTKARRPVKVKLSILKDIREGRAGYGYMGHEEEQRRRDKREEEIRRLEAEIREMSPGLEAAEEAVDRHELMLKILESHMKVKGREASRRFKDERSKRRADPKLRERVREAATNLMHARNEFAEAYKEIEWKNLDPYFSIPSSEEDIERLMRGFEEDSD